MRCARVCVRVFFIFGDNGDIRFTYVRRHTPYFRCAVTIARFRNTECVCDFTIIYRHYAEIIKGNFYIASQVHLISYLRGCQRCRSSHPSLPLTRLSSSVDTEFVSEKSLCGHTAQAMIVLTTVHSEFYSAICILYLLYECSTTCKYNTIIKFTCAIDNRGRCQ